MDNDAAPASGALSGLRVLDFSTLLPGPLASLMLGECGAEVIKIERPGSGDDMRERAPRLGADSAGFALLNRGKRSVALDLKQADAVTQLTPLIAAADVLLEQFRPGVMDRLGLGYAATSAINPRLVYCSLTGYGQAGPRAQVAGHDLNYVADAGLLSLSAAADGLPPVPPVAIADLAGGTQAALINILLALQQRALTGHGCHLDIAMADNLWPFAYAALARGFAAGDWPAPGADEWTGASPRYRCYRTRDDRFIAVGAVEEKFWRTFCAGLEIAPAAATADAVASRIATRTAAEWEQTFAGRDACVSVVRTMAEAAAAAHVRSGWALRTVSAGGRSIPALPLPISPVLRHARADEGYPALGEANALLDQQQDTR